ncbi:MAG: vWA domain-containing protein [Phycisphaeraceae bacterium]|nr:vWA domain-containing protein [Phycisphaeraceae bacterium]
MKTLSTRTLAAALLALAAWMLPPAGAQVVAPPAEAAEEAPERPHVQLAILLDNSGSMSGLIDQARGQIWQIINDLALARHDGQRPHLEVALYIYGNPPATQLVPLTTDLDLVSERLFAVTTAGGSEYCGAVIQTAVNDLAWRDGHADLKMIFIAGNEPFNQGPVDYREACRAAIAKGITVNTIHCGDGLPEGWREGAQLADGQATTINHNQTAVAIAAPQDEKILALNQQLNQTYVPFGQQGAEGFARQQVQDANASKMSKSNLAQRAAAKASGYYQNAGWDLVDAQKQESFDWADVKDEDLPENMQKMSLEERKAYIAGLEKERKELREKISKLNQARVAFVTEKRKEQSEDALDRALIESIRTQARNRDYDFTDEKE